MKLSEYAKTIIFGEKLEDKLIDPDCIDFDDWREFIVPSKPSRGVGIELSEKNMRFPRGHFHLDEKKAMALHSFANHELLAIEMMACALLLYPHHTPELKKFKMGVIASLKDEQKHFKLYSNRLNDIGFNFGDFVLNEFFWKQMSKLKTPSMYLSVMALTFEAANLDFAHHYKYVFKELGDEKTANILNTVLEDEITHVSLGVHFLNKWREDKSLWTYYLESLPWPLTPARGKGKFFIEEVRRKSRMDDDFISQMKNYQDGFRITKRREWDS